MDEKKENMETTNSRNLARRPRLNEDWPISSYSFDCWPQEKPPDSLWETAHQMRRLWNDLTAIFVRARELDTRDDSGSPLHSKEERAAIYYPFQQRKSARSANNEAYAARYDLAQSIWGAVPSLAEVGKRYLGVIPAACYESVIARFIVTFKNWRKNHAQRGEPHFKSGPLLNVNIPLVFNAGISVHDLATGKSVQLRDTYALRHNQAAQAEYLRNGWFDIGCQRDRLPLHVAYHRPLPPGCRIKRVSLIGRRGEHLGWRWQLQVQLEHPPDAPRLTRCHAGEVSERLAYALREPTGRVAGLDLGWRMRDGYLRIGFLTDNGGNRYELCLPLDFGNKATRKHNRRAAKKWRGADAGEWQRLSEWQHLKSEQAKLDDELNAVKLQIKQMADELLELPAPLQNFRQHYDKVRGRSLRNLLDDLTALNTTPEIVTVLQEWDVRSRLQWKRWAGAFARATMARRDWYRKLAAWLAENFDLIAWKGALDLKEIAEAETDHPARRNAEKWRVAASLSTLRPLIRQAFEKRKGILQDEELKFPSSLCAVVDCGAAIVSEPHKLVHLCENGHQEDQDATASGVFLSRIKGSVAITLPPVEIPHELRRCVRIVGRDD